jgi:hypothetical protein
VADSSCLIRRAVPAACASSASNALLAVGHTVGVICVAKSQGNFQMLALTVAEGLLCSPAELTATIWKYQLPALRLSTT